MKKLLFSLSFLLLLTGSYAQSYFEDGLSAEWHRGRRDAIREMMPPNSVAVMFNNPVKNRSNDVDFIYHPDTDFFYLTGLREPNSALLIFSEKRMIDGVETDEIIFVQPRDPRAEMWNGKRLGTEGAKEKLGFALAYVYDDFGKKPAVDFSDFEKVLSFNLSGDIESGSSNVPLKRMVNNFKKASGYPMEVSDTQLQLYELIRSADAENSDNIVQVIARYSQRNPDVANDPIIKDFLIADSPEKRMKVKDQVPGTKTDIFSLDKMLEVLREVKTEEEIALLKSAAKISAIGQVEVMKAAKPGMSEREIQGIHEFIYKRYGAEDVGYPSIVGGGNNGCILHYIENDMKHVNDRLLLMDLGAEWRGYTADVTRTIPVSGQFNKEERAIYELVFKAQEAGIALCKPGTSFAEIGQVTRQIINEGLADLGIIKRGQSHNYFPHGTSHHLGLDVHDRGSNGPLKEGAVLTVEPGIYIPEGSDCDPKWWGIAVRIEDDILVTSNGPVNLSGDAPRTVEAIEAMMKIPSILENWVLPEIN
ncbi:aminopeptidase P N-terminal domain-containing protein [Algoriphagus sp. CAU 1675]|uniref:aminopeptidase P N-terminal domain-containing protein n=1 Tax=Algoriphagus sp. CAU 1675 TaxID=3032597 RepID=UPI0023DCDE13|nr:aminopeptidase P N-terminal domain-containing protein [Algoriphagus sp. CAU 1675]MDF2156987.1 aminopeptidase P N-terminal domain-containing protein [Algoriphagus sp. CAU 1675]